jgi:hypothetical protein
MVFQPISTDDIYENLRDRIIDRTEDLTNFSERSVNYTLARYGFAEYWRLFEHGMLAIQLSGWAEFAGGPIDEEDLRLAGITEPEDVNLPLLNFFMDDSDLDALAAQNGIERDPGSFAVGEVLFSVSQEQTEVPAGTAVETEADAAGDILRYETTRRVISEEGEGGVIAPIQAEERGPEYNVGSGLIVNIPESTAGLSSVTNLDATYDGEEPEDNDSLRIRVQNSLTRSSGGGTVHGLIGSIESAIDGVEEGDVTVDEVRSPDPGTDPRGRSAPYGDVVVNGGDEDDVRDAIERYRPSCIDHFLVRPTSYQLDIDIRITGESVNINAIESNIINYVSELKLGDNMRRAKLYQVVLNTDSDIVNVTDISVSSDATREFLGDLLVDEDEIVIPGSVSVSVREPTP